MWRWPRRGPLSLAKGARPASAAIWPRPSVPSSGRWPSRVAAVPGPTPLSRQSRAALAARVWSWASRPGWRALAGEPGPASLATALGRPGTWRACSAANGCTRLWQPQWLHPSSVLARWPRPRAKWHLARVDDGHREACPRQWAAPNARCTRWALAAPMAAPVFGSPNGCTRLWQPRQGRHWKVAPGATRGLQGWSSEPRQGWTENRRWVALWLPLPQRNKGGSFSGGDALITPTGVLRVVL